MIYVLLLTKLLYQQILKPKTMSTSVKPLCLTYQCLFYNIHKDNNLIDRILIQECPRSANKKKTKI